jgi:hypothetical protein
MSTTSLEKRVADLETRYAQLLQLVQARPSQNDWRSVVGLFADDPLIDQLHADARRIRDEDRAATSDGDS